MEEDVYSQFPEFDNHTLVARIDDTSVGLRGYIAIHRNRGAPSLGATRLWAYATEEEALRDALRLSRLMSYKSALAGLPYGGAKATIIASPEALRDRAALFKAYGKKVNELMGQFVTGTDVGVDEADLQAMKESTSFVIGSGVNSGYFTAQGVYYGIQEAFRHLYGSPDIKGHTFAIQGVGKTGGELLQLLYDDAAQIVIADINEERLREVQRTFPNI